MNYSSILACGFASLICVIPTPALSQHMYTRKAVAGVESITFKEKKVQITPSQAKIFIEELSTNLITNRFDDVKLPQSVQNDLKMHFHLKLIDKNKINAHLDKIATPFFENVMRVTAEERAEKNKAGFDRAIFITDKAKEIGITAQDLDGMMRCGYVFVPYISLVEINKQKADGKYSARVAGGVYWYHLEEFGGSATLSRVGSFHSDCRSSGFLKKTADEAFRDAASKVARNVFLETANSPELQNVFSTKAVITEKKGNKLFFTLGKKEDLKLDDRFEVYEITEQNSGNVVYKKIGHCMVSRVADNKENPGATSQARCVTGGGFLPGMEVREVPLSGLDFSLRTVWFQTTLDYIPEESGFSVKNPSNGGAYGIELETAYNFGPHIGVSQFYTLFVLNYKYIPVNVALAIDSEYHWDISQADSWSGYWGLMKRFYAGPIALRFDTVGGFSTFKFNMSAIEDTDPDEKRTLETKNFDIRAAAGIEFAISTKSIFGFYAGYRYMLFDWTWGLEDDGNKVDEFDADDGINQNGYFMGISFTYAMKSL